METVSIVDREAVTGGWKFSVRVESGETATEHRVMLERAHAEAVTGYRFRNDADVDDFLRKTFQFLLERESKESILGAFNVRDVQRYFPEFAYLMRD